MIRTFSLLALAFSTTASAGIYTGSVTLPTKTFRADMDLVSAIAEIAAVEVAYCDGSIATHVVDDTYDFVKGFDLVVTDGDLCSAEIHLNSPVYITGEEFTLVSDPGSVVIDLAGSTVTPASNAKLVSGRMTNPENLPYFTLAN